MNGIVSILLFGAIVLIAYRIEREISRHAAGISHLSEKVAEIEERLASQIREVQYTLASPEHKERLRFERLPDLTAELMESFEPGHRLNLLLNSAFHGFIPLDYIHRELTYRSPGKRDAVAIGQAKYRDACDYADVRILFSQPNRTATLRGLAEEGHVKQVR